MATALILTHSRDSYVPDKVAEAVVRLGHRPLRIDTDRYPASLDLQLHVGTDCRARIRVDGAWVDDVAAVYQRRLAPPSNLSGDAGSHRIVGRECRMHWTGLQDILADARWINPPAAASRVEGHKLRQLAVARRVGLAVPDTLVTNDPDEVRAFSAAHGHDLVCKMLHNAHVSLSGGGPRIPTRRLTREDHAHLDALRAGPMCFQPRVRAREELRVAWVAGQAFVGRLMLGEDEVDWRARRTRWLPGALDADTHQRLCALMDALGLVQGAIDLMVPDEGPPVFLEVNPAGEWGMLEHALGLPISQALAAALLEAA